jgi:hypothetical protein
MRLMSCVSMVVWGFSPVITRAGQSIFLLAQKKVYTFMEIFRLHHNTLRPSPRAWYFQPTWYTAHTLAVHGRQHMYMYIHPRQQFSLKKNCLGIWFVLLYFAFPEYLGLNHVHVYVYMYMQLLRGGCLALFYCPWWGRCLKWLMNLISSDDTAFWFTLCKLGGVSERLCVFTADES